MSGLLFPPAGQGMLKRMVRLQRKKYREEEEMFLAEGVRTVRELLLHLPDPDSLVALFLTPDAEALLPEAEAYSGKVLSVDSVDFLRMTGTETPQGVAGVFRQPRFCPLEELPVGGEGRMVVALDGVQDPGNAGTILRTAAWFGADALLSGPGTVDLYNPKTVRSSAGSTLSLPHYSVNNLETELEGLQRNGYEVVCSSLKGHDFREFPDWPARKVLVVGNEANGISEGVLCLADRLVLIPHGRGGMRVESLNASVSAAVLLDRLML
ncbi:MAG: RNA methyltransferase [Candidatus Chlorobium antarcticum]|nr:RNA methyltransferase [Candidatus Chlorobium antarcticum]